MRKGLFIFAFVWAVLSYNGYYDFFSDPGLYANFEETLSYLLILIPLHLSYVNFFNYELLTYDYLVIIKSKSINKFITKVLKIVVKDVVVYTSILCGASVITTGDIHVFTVAQLSLFILTLMTILLLQIYLDLIISPYFSILIICFYYFFTSWFAVLIFKLELNINIVYTLVPVFLQGDFANLTNHNVDNPLKWMVMLTISVLCSVTTVILLHQGMKRKEFL